MINNIRTNFNNKPINFAHRDPSSQQQQRVAIVDVFSNGIAPNLEMDINGDGIKDLYHGHFTEGVLRSSGPHSQLPEIERFEDDGSDPFFINTIKTITERNSDDNPDNDIEWLNISISYDAETPPCFSDEENPDKEVDNGIREKIIGEMPSKIKKELLALGELAQTSIFSGGKTAVYTMAGNLGKEHFNLFSVVKGIKSIGGLNEKNEISIFSGKNLLQGKNDWAPLEFVCKLVEDENSGEPLGYDIAPKGKEGDGEIDIDFSDPSIKISGDYKGNNPSNPILKEITIKGTSGSTPYKLGKDYQAKQAGKTEWNPFTDTYV